MDDRNVDVAQNQQIVLPLLCCEEGCPYVGMSADYRPWASKKHVLAL